MSNYVLVQAVMPAIVYIQANANACNEAASGQMTVTFLTLPIFPSTILALH